MSLRRLLVAILMMLGLQAPGGLTFRICFCNGLFGGASSHAHACGSKRVASCCSEQAEDPPLHRLQGTGDTGCRCVLVSTPAQPTSKAVPNDASFAMPSSSALVRVVRIREPGAQSREWARPRAHDPPWTRANVPLRI